jgi:peptide/nickel transport system permease protein
VTWLNLPWWVGDLIQNLIPVALVALLVFALRRARNEPLWADAFRRLRRNGVAMVSLAVILLYCAVAIADTVGWRNGKAGEYRTVLQRVADVPKEYYYSAPLARETTGEPKPHRLNRLHLLGTDAVGSDVLFLTLHGTRTALIIGGFSLLLLTPFALLLGLAAGYFGKLVDDSVQYTYTVLDSIPGILLLVSIMLVLGRGLWQLCVALSVANWVGLCRIVRGETMKLREREYVRAARALGVGHGQILMRHILPNLAHLVVINLTLAFSGLVLSEAILAYLGLGVGGDIGSWGNMIDAARLELAREPVIWWNLASASGALLLLVLAFNLFSDALQDALNPRLRS